MGWNHFEGEEYSPSPWSQVDHRALVCPFAAAAAKQAAAAREADGNLPAAVRAFVNTIPADHGGGMVYLTMGTDGTVSISPDPSREDMFFAWDHPTQRWEFLPQ